MYQVPRVAAVMGLLAAVFVIGSGVHADMIWFDGSREAGNTPPGKLLTENLNYYGESVFTGVDYTLGSDAQSYASKSKKPKPTPARPLLDGNPGSGISGTGPLVVVFDFTRNCTFSEMDVCSQSGKVGIKIEAADEPDQWRTIYEQKLADSPGGVLHRIKLAEKPQGRYVQLTVEAQGETKLDEFMAWGDAEVTAENPEASNPVMQTMTKIGWCDFSIPGIDKMGIVFNEFNDWQMRNQPLSKIPVVWSQVPTWDQITTRPILPEKDKINKPVSMVVARNMTECAAVAMTCTTWPKELVTEVRLSGFRSAKDGRPAPNIKGKLRVMGAIPSAIFGVVLGPLFEADNMLGLGAMKHYLTNGDSIHDFPKIKLNAMTSAVMWLSVTTDGAQPGFYEADLSCSTPGVQPMKIKVEVVDVTLPDTYSWIISYSNSTNPMFPFNYDDRNDREVEYRHDIGLNVYHYFPERGSVQEAARKYKDSTFLIYCMPGDYVSKNPKDYTEADKKTLADAARNAVAHAKSLGLDYSQYYLELGDEPGREALVSYEAICKIMHEADPNVRIYANPTSEQFGDWYDKHIQVSCPFFKTAAYDAKSEAKFHGKRWVNGYYYVATNSAKGERTDLCERYRRFAWESIIRGWNGWGFYAYYRPEGDGWNDFDVKNDKGQASPDFEMVYPGPRGPVPTRQSEAVREGKEDYRLMSLLRSKGLNKEADAIVKAYKQGVPCSELRLRALRAAAKK